MPWRAILFLSLLFASPAYAEVDAQRWKVWPFNDAAVCAPRIIERLDTYLDKPGALLDLSACAHTSIGNVEAFAYAASQLGSTKQEAFRTVLDFTRKIAAKPDETAFCFKSAGVEPFDKAGSWRDTVEVLQEIAPALERMDSRCTQMLQ